MAATVLGGYVLAVAGFGALGVLTCCFGFFGATLALAHWLWPGEAPARALVATPLSDG